MTPAKTSGSGLRNRHTPSDTTGHKAAVDFESPEDKQESPAQILWHMEELSRLQASEARALQQVAQLRLQLDLLEAQKGQGEFRQLEDRIAHLAEGNASLEAALAAAEEKSNEKAAAHLSTSAKLEEAEEQLANLVSPGVYRCLFPLLGPLVGADSIVFAL